MNIKTQLLAIDTLTVVYVILVIGILLAALGGCRVEASVDGPWGLYEVTCYSGDTIIFEGQVAHLVLHGSSYTRTYTRQLEDNVPGDVMLLPDNCIFIQYGQLEGR